MKRLFIFWCALTLVFCVIEARAYEHTDLIVSGRAVFVELMEAVFSDDYSTIDTHYKASVSFIEPFDYILFQYNDLFTDGCLLDMQTLNGYDFLVNTAAHQILINRNNQTLFDLVFQFEWNTGFVNTSPDLVPVFFDSTLIPLEDASWSVGQDPYITEGTFLQPSDIASALATLNNPDRPWHHSFYGGLTVTPQEHPILLVDTSSPTSPIPEPATMLLLGSGLVGIAALRRKLRRDFEVRR